MLISCDCLNIILSSSSSQYSENQSSNECFPNNNFFKEDIAVLSLCSVTIRVPSLVKEKIIGDWKLVSCLNCGQACYGTSKCLPLGSLFVKRNLEKEPSQLNALKKSNLYSPIFKIIIYDNDKVLDNDFDLKISLYPAALSWLSEQTAKTEERIKIFAEKEYIALEELRKKACKDQIAINRKEKETLKEKNKRNSIENTVDTSITSITPSYQFQKKEITDFEDTSIESEGVFLLEGFESSGSARNRNYESDSESSDNEIDSTYMYRKNDISQLAKSLPIPVPQFMEDRRHNEPRSRSPQVPTDIAASIKALAKSVHGDAIFGELPRPRFSTNL